jgi:hypothetical protein
MSYHLLIDSVHPIARHRINLTCRLLEGRITMGDAMRLPLRDGTSHCVNVLGFELFGPISDPPFVDAGPAHFALTFLRHGLNPDDIVVGGVATGESSEPS